MPQPLPLRFEQIEQNLLLTGQLFDEIAEHEDEFELVTDGKFVAAQPKESITLRFDDETLAELTELARAEHTSPATLAHRWILERLAATATSS